MLQVRREMSLRSPLLLAAFSGWPDASLAATGALRYLRTKYEVMRLAELDPEQIFCYTITRPVTRMIDRDQRTFRYPRLSIFGVQLPFTSRDLVQNVDKITLVLGGERRRRAEIVGSDRDAGAVEAALANAEAAGVGSNVAVRLASVSELELPSRAGWLVTNPPYGERVGGPDLRNLYDRFGAVLRERAGGWNVAVLASHDTPVQRLRLPLERVLDTSNGGIDVSLHRGTVPVAPGTVNP